MNFERLNRILNKLEEQRLSQMVISDPSAIYYLTGGYIEPDERLLALYINRNGKHKLLINHLFSAPKDLGIEQIGFDDTDDAVALLCSVIERGKPLGIDKTMTARFLLPLIQQLGASAYIQ